MARDPDEGDAVVFDLVDDDAAVAGGPDTELAESAPLASDGPGRKRRAAAQVAGILAIVLGTGLAVDGMRDHARIERMRDIDGGLADVSSPLTETWQWSGPVSVGGMITDVAVLGDELVFESEGRLVALDPATGTEAWTVPLREDAECDFVGLLGHAGTGQPDGPGRDGEDEHVDPDRIRLRSKQIHPVSRLGRRPHRTRPG